MTAEDASSTSPDLATIARVVALSVAKMVLGGAIAAGTYRHMCAGGKADKSLLKNLSFVNKEVMLPCFIFVNVSSGVSAELVSQIWTVPFFIAICVAFGYVSGRAAACLTRTPPSQQPVAVTVVTFSNVIGLPLPLLMSLIDGLDQWADKDDFHSRGTSYLFLANCVQSTLMWSMAGPMLAARKHERSSTGSMLGEGAARSDDVQPSETPSTAVAAAAVARSAGAECTKAAETTLELDAAASNGNATAAMASPARRRLRERARAAASSISEVLNRPVKASIFGIVVGCTPLRNLLATEDAPLRWVLDAMYLLGKGAIPSILFTLGAQLSNGPAGGAMPLRSMIGALVAKLLVVPALALALLVSAVRLGVVPLGDGLLPLAMLIVGSSPTAMNISLIATLQGTGAKEVASIMFYEYLFAIITISLVASAGLMMFL